MLHGHLTGDYKSLLDRLVDKLGVPDYGFLYTRKIMKYSYPLTEPEIVQLSPDELLDFLKQWTPHNIIECSYRDWGATVATVIVSDLNKYKNHLVAIASCHAGFAYSLLQNFIENKKESPMPWSLCLDLCEKLLKNDVIRKDISRGYDANWVEVRRSILSLLEKGLQNSEDTIPVEYLPRLRDILLVLVDDPDPDTRADNPPADYSGHNNPSHIALNHVRPKALSILIEYARHYAILVQESQAQHGPKGHESNRLEEIVQKTLTRKLDRQADPSWSVYSVYGQNLTTLHWLNFAWVKENIHRIFPEGNDEQSIRFYIAAWDSFVSFHYHYGCAEMLALLRPKYERAIENVNKGYMTQTHSDPGKNLAQHIAWEYLRGNYNLHSPTGQQSLIALFCRKAPPEAISGLAWCAWRICEKYQDQRNKYWPKIRALWGLRHKMVAEANHPTEFDQEMQYFAYLPSLAPSSESIVTLWHLLKGLVPHIVRANQYLTWHAIETYLTAQVSDYPLKTIEFYQYVYEHMSSPNLFLYERARTYKILAATAAHSDSRAQTLTLIESMARQGVYDYDEIYKKYG